MTLTDTALPHVRVLWRPKQFNRVDNTSFEVDTSGWSVSAGINAAATSITRITTDSYVGSACGRLITTAVNGSGVNFDLGADRYFPAASYGTAYAALVWLKRVSGAYKAKLILGSEGTSSDRGELDIDLRDDWTPYRVVWQPTASRTDAQLAITNGYAAALTVRIDNVTLWQLDAMSQLENSNFMTTTAGWDDTGAYIAAAASSLTRIVGAGMDPNQQTCGALVTTTTNGSGVSYPLGNRKFTSGRTYTFRVAIRRVSGATNTKLIFGSNGTALDRASSSVATTTGWDIYSVDWTPSADRTDACAVISNASGAAMGVRFGLAEVYESSDDVSSPYLMDMEWWAGMERLDPKVPVGRFQATLNDSSKRFFPTNSSSPLYGSLTAGQRIWARATYNGDIFPIFFGSVQKIVPDGEELTTDLLAQDPFLDLANADYEAGFTENISYTDVRFLVLSGISGNDYSPAGVPYTRVNTVLIGIEGGYFFSGNESAPALSVLESMNEATGTFHCIRPSAVAEVLWQYTTINRTTITDDTVSDETIDDDFADMTGIFADADALENRQFVPWQGFERGKAPDDDGTGFGIVVSALDVATYAHDEQDPYLHFLDESYGNDDNVPEPTFERISRRTKKGRKKVRQVRIYPDPFVPFDMAAGETREFTLDFSIPMSGTVLVLDGPTGATNIITTTVESYPRHIVFRLFAAAADTVDYFVVYATPWTTLDEQVADVIAYQSATNGLREGPTFQTPFIGSNGMALGLGAYRNWLYSVGRMRPLLRTENRFPTSLQRQPGNHVTVNAARWGISGQVFTITGLHGTMDTGARDWAIEYNLEEVPAGAPWFTLDSSALDGSDSLAY